MATVDYTKTPSQPSNLVKPEFQGVAAPSTNNSETSITGKLFGYLFAEHGRLSRGKYILCKFLVFMILPIILIKLLKSKPFKKHFTSKRNIFITVAILLSVYLFSIEDSNDLIEFIAFMLSFTVGVYVLIKSLIGFVILNSRISDKRLRDTESKKLPINNFIVKYVLGLIGTLINFIFLLTSPSSTKDEEPHTSMFKNIGDAPPIPLPKS